MYTADVMAIVLSALAFLLSLQGLWLFCRAMWPTKVIASATRCGRNPLKSFVAGLVVTLLMIVATALVGRAGAPGQVAGFGIVSLYVIFSGIGVAGLVTHIGQRLSSPADDRRPWAATLRGGIVLNLTYVIPIVGWFVILPASVVLGAGAATMALLWPRTARVAPSHSPAASAGYPPPPPAPYAPAGQAHHPAEVLG